MRRASRRRSDDSRSPRRRAPDDSRSPVRGLVRKQRRSRSRRKGSRGSRGKGYDRSRSRSVETAAAAKSKVDPKQAPAVQTPTPAPKPASEAVPDWLSDLFPGGGAPGQPVAPAPPAVTTEPIEIPLSLCGVLLNDNGSALRSIMNASGAEINLRQELQHLGYSLGIISGTPDACRKAKEMLQQQVGLMGTGHITKEIEVMTNDRSTDDAVKFAFEELRNRKANNVPVRILWPETPGAKVRIAVGPGSVAHVATVEQVIRKKLRSIELDDCFYQGRPVPAEKKVTIMCKYFKDGVCPRGAGCNYAHSDQELAVAQRASLPSAAGIEDKSQPVPSPLPSSTMQQVPGSSATSGLI